MTKPNFQPKFANYKAKIFDSFNRQGLMTTLGAEIDHIEAGAVDISLSTGSDVGQQHGYVHGGAVTSIADSAAGYAALSLLPEEKEVLTIEAKINFLSPAKGEKLIACARVIKAGRTISYCQCEVFSYDNGQETLVACLSATLMTAAT